MEATMTPLMERPMPSPLAQPQTQTSEPEPLDEPPMYYYQQPEPEKELLANLDRQTMILLFAAFFIGFLLGSLRRPVILKT